MPDDTTLLAPADSATGSAPIGTGSGDEGDPGAKAIEDARKRQSGAEKARAEAERLRDEALAELAAFKGKPPKDDGSAGPDTAAIKRELEAQYEKKLADATAKVTGEALNARFPAARAKFPGITDTVQLAELEVIYGDSEKPIGNNAARGNAGTKSIDDMSVAELRQHMRGMSHADMGIVKAD